MSLRVSLLVGMVLLLAGCMQALRGHDGTEGTHSSSSLSWPKPLALASKTPSPADVAQRDQQSAMEVTLSSPAPTPMREEEHAIGVLTTAEEEPRDTEVPPTSLPSTVTPTTAVLVEAVPSPTPTIEQFVVLPTTPPLSKEERWHAQQQHREVFTPHRIYTTTGSELWWYDHVNEQHVALGSFSGEFEAQARFVLAKTEQPALEVPYHLNESYGLEALSPALMERIRTAGYGEWIDAYVLLTDEVQHAQ